MPCGCGLSSVGQSARKLFSVKAKACCIFSVGDPTIPANTYARYILTKKCPVRLFDGFRSNTLINVVYSLTAAAAAAAAEGQQQVGWKGGDDDELQIIQPPPSRRS
jgi:hypothetical protein